MKKSKKHQLMQMYEKLFDHFGHQSWWPGETPLEIMVGAVLTQNTSWRNVEKAILNLKRNGYLSFSKLKSVSEPKLAELIRPAGYFNVKAKRLKNLISFLDQECGGQLERLRQHSMEDLRQKLLSVSGVGPETADSILLYAFNQRSFVIDAYTRRVFSRHGLIPSKDTYEDWRRYFMAALPHNEALFNDYHAQIVAVSKAFCRTKPSCEQCPLESFFTSVSAKKSRSFTDKEGHKIK